MYFCRDCGAGVPPGRALNKQLQLEIRHLKAIDLSSADLA
jgi:hypothetical protein